jgi:ABC-type transporter Mla MlaB component
MKRHLTLASSDRLAAVGRQVHVPPTAGHGRPAGTLQWRHTLILEGRLDERSRLELEDEVECLYQEGVTSLRLDLSRLQDVDAAGVQALANLATRGRRRGQHVDVVAGTGAVGKALAWAGVQDLLASDGFEPPLGGIDASLRGSLPARSTTMVKGLT